MACLRVSSIYALIRLLARLIALGGDIAWFALMCYTISHWGQFGPAYALAIVAVIISFAANISVVMTFLDFSQRLTRINSCCLVTSDILVMGLGVGGFIMILMSDYGYGNAPSDFPRPWGTTKQMSAWLMIAIVAYHFILSIWTCTDAGVRNSQAKKRKEVMRTVEPTAQDQNGDKFTPAPAMK